MGKENIERISFLTYRGKSATYGYLQQNENFYFRFERSTFGLVSSGFAKTLCFLGFQVVAVPQCFLDCFEATTEQ